MIYFQGTTDFYMAGPSAVTLGKFDGVHRGHQKLLETVRRAAGGTGTSVVFAFNANRSSLLLTDEEQRSCVEDLGIDAFVRCPFVPEISGMTPDEFVRKILLEKLHAALVVVGSDFRFGHNRAGDAAWLTAHQEQYALKVRVIEKETYEGREISSTYLREALSLGDMELVHSLMGRPYPVHGNVIHGRHLGTSLGLPTANLVAPPEKLLPPDGVYMSNVTVNGHRYWGMTNIGYKPTVDGTFRGIETYLYDCDENLYGCPMQVELLHYQRPERKFAGLEELTAQIRSDVESGWAYFKANS